MVDLVLCEPPEDDPSPFGAEELVLPVVGDRARQDVVRLGAGELIKSPEAEVEPHLLLEAIELLLGACWIKAASTFKDGDPKAQDAVGPDPEGVVGQGIPNQEMIAQLLLVAEFAGLLGLLVVLDGLGKGPLLEGFRQSSSDREGEDVGRDPLTVCAAHTQSLTAHGCVRMGELGTKKRRHQNIPQPLTEGELSCGGSGKLVWSCS